MTFRFSLLILTFIIFFFSAQIANAKNLPLKNVVVTTSGLAVYGHEGEVKGEAVIDLPVRLGQVDDILKSLVVIQLMNGELHGVTLPGREPLSQVFRDLPFSQADLKSYARLLNALRGAEVSIDDGFITGRLLSVTEEKLKTDEGIITCHRVSISTKSGVKTTVLEDTENLEFTEAEVQAQIDRALQAVFSNRIQDQRTLKIRTSGGERNVGLVYILEAPLWKSSYRILLPPEGEKEASIQGWAVLENTTGQDWKGVNLTLMSGSPVTYHQALYESYYTQRPELPVKIMNRVMPRVDKGAVPRRPEKQKFSEEKPMRSKSRSARMDNMTLGSDAASGMPPMPSMEMADAEAAPVNMSRVHAAAAAETASQLVFRFPQKVDLPAGHSLMVPFIDRQIPAERLYLYQPDTDPRHPLASVFITNDSESGLPPGIATLYDGETGEDIVLHVGDAEMPLVPKGEDRFISFALDTKTTIDREDSRDRRLGIITIARGSLRQKVLWLNTTGYTIKAPEDEDRTVIIEQPRRNGWELDKPEGIEDGIKKSETHYRLRVKVPAGETRNLDVTMRKEGVENIAVSSINPAELDRRIAAASGKIPSDVRRALEKISRMRAEIYSYEQIISRVEQERRRIYNDQNRLRQNLSTISQSSSLGRRYLSQMEEQEDRLENLAEQEHDAREDLRKSSEELEEYISGLNF